MMDLEKGNQREKIKCCPSFPLKAFDHRGTHGNLNQVFMAANKYKQGFQA